MDSKKVSSDMQLQVGKSRFIMAILFGIVLVLAAAAFLFQNNLRVLESEETVVGNLGFFLLINLNIVIVMVLGFLVIKNILKLGFDRRRKMLGSKLRSRLVTAFVGLSLIPTVLLFTVAKGILERVLQGWFSPQVSTSVDGAVEIAGVHQAQAEKELSRKLLYLSQSIAKLGILSLDTVARGPISSGAASASLPSGDNSRADSGSDTKLNISGIHRYLDHKRQEYGLSSISLFNGNNQLVLELPDLKGAPILTPAIPDPVSSPNLAFVSKARLGKTTIRPEHTARGEYLRGYAAVGLSPTDGPFLLDRSTISPENKQQNQSPSANSYVIVASELVPSALSQALAKVIDSQDDYNELRTYHRPLASSYLLTLVIVTLLIIFSAVWVGFYLARGLSVPIGLLAEGTQQVAHGNLNYRIPELGDDELSVLVKSFNTMTQDLKTTTDELIARRRYMETVLAQVGVGVISIDNQEIVTTCNDSARSILGMQNSDALMGQKYHVGFPEGLSGSVNLLLAKIYSGERLVSDPVTLSLGGNLKHLQLTVTRLVGDDGATLGTVILLDDITELVGAQRMAAWRDVARRIAHEIKNPLTPIQLNAQRIQRKFGGVSGNNLLSLQILKESDRGMISDATSVIVKQVEILRNLVNEFSRFARMPRAKLEVSNLRIVVEETTAFYREAHPAIVFRQEIPEFLPEFPFDREQINRVLVNLLDNAVSSIITRVELEEQRSVSVQGEIQVSVGYNCELEIISIEVADNGIGIPDSDKAKLFEPYFSTKRSGTGLGLAIVNAIVTDHLGFVRFRDNYPYGAKFVVELPAKREFLRKVV